MTFKNTTTPNNLYTQNAGNSSSNPFVIEFQNRDPNTSDVNFPIQKLWFNYILGDTWMLLSFIITAEVKTANWVRISGESAQVETLTGDTGGPVGPDALNDIQVLGTANQITTTGNPATNTITWSLANGTSVSSFNVDAHTAPGTDPVLPNSSGQVTITGGQVAAGTTTNVIRTDSLAANTYTVEVQRSSAQSVSTLGANGVSHYNDAQFDVDANGFVSIQSGVGLQYAKWVVNPTPGLGTQTTIQAAINAASAGDIIFIYQGIYTENLTLKAGVTLTSWNDANGNGNVTIKGKTSYSGSGITACSNLNFETNGDYAIQGTLSGLNFIFFSQCGFVGTDHTILNWTNSSATPSNIFFYNSSWDLQTTGIAYFQIDAGSMGSSTECSFFNNFMSNTAVSTTASTTANGAASFYNSVVSAPLASSGGGGIIGQDTYFFANNVPCITFDGSGSTYFNGCEFSSGTATALVCNGVIPLYNCNIFSTNTNAISGSGTTAYAGIVFGDGFSQTISTTNQRSTNGGSFTPVLAFGGASTGITYSTQAGTYLRVDNTCQFTIQIILTSKGSSTGAATITGLPFSSRTFQVEIIFSQRVITFDAGNTYVVASIPASSTTINLFEQGSATQANLTNTNFANTSEIYITGHYFI